MNLKKIKDSKSKKLRVKDSEDDLELLATSYVSKENAIDLYNSGYTVVTIPSGVDTNEYVNAVLRVLEDLFDEPEVNFDYGRKDLETSVNNNLLEISVSQVTDSSKTKISDAELSAEEQQEIIDWILANYKKSKNVDVNPKALTFKGNVVSCKHGLVLNKDSKSLTNGKFTWGTVKTQFVCSGCHLLKSLEGAPQNLDGVYFNCSNCSSLTTLIGAPQTVKYFICSHCKNLTSLEGAPQTAKTFNCSNCTSLTSLKGAPQKVEEFSCHDCTSLKNLIGAPQEVEDFFCDHCTSLTSLEGAPQKVEEFSCYECISLTSLKGAPQEVTRHFNCYYCKSLKSLKGAPKTANRSFRCSGCTSLTSLKGAPQTVEEFYCDGCTSLTSLKGAPKEVSWFECNDCTSLKNLKGAPKTADNFTCVDCGGKFTEEDVREVCNVSGKIYTTVKSLWS